MSENCCNFKVLKIKSLQTIIAMITEDKVTEIFGAPDKPCGVGRADANPKLLLNDT